MKNISLVKTPDELLDKLNGSGVYTDRKVLNFYWMVEQEVYDRLLPPGLEPAPQPMIYAYVGYFPHSGFQLPEYKEGGIFLCCARDGIAGVYCLSMPIDCAGSEMGILQGRETYGLPKKEAKIEYRRMGDRIYVSIERSGIKYFEAEGEFGEWNKPELEPYFVQQNLGVPHDALLYTYDADLVCEDPEKCPGACLEFRDIKLYRQRNIEFADCDLPVRVALTFRESEDDPWIELAPRPEQVIGGRYQDSYCNMMGCEVVERFQGEKADALLPYLFTAYDSNLFCKPHDMV